MAGLQLNVRAHDLNRRLDDLCFELGCLLVEANRAIDADATAEFGAAVAAVNVAREQLAACDLVIDASRDPKDQSYKTAATTA